MSQECTSYKTVSDPTSVGAYHLLALLAIRELEERHGKILVLVDDSIVPLQLKGCGFEVMNNLYSRSTHQASKGGICVCVGDLIPFNLEKNEVAKG